MNSNVTDTYFKLKEAILIREVIKAGSVDEEDFAAAELLIAERWSALADTMPAGLLEARLLIDALEADIGEAGDATSLAIARNLAIYFGQLAAKADISADEFELAMIGAGRIGSATPAIDGAC